MTLNLKEIDSVKTLSKKDFIKYYYKPQKPVVVTQGINDWPAYTKWNLDYIREKAGNKIVPLYDDRPVNYKDAFNEPHKRMKMKDYIDLLKAEPTKYRIFLWNILKEVPELQNDFSYPDFGLRLLKSLPMLFFGGKDSYTFMHYDIDLANILHYHFEGKKKCILFPQSESKYLYKIPSSLITREDINFSDPDLEKWPVLKKAKGFVTELEHGNMLYIPEGYWHYMQYITPGFSMSLRALARKPLHLGKAIYNIIIMRSYDNTMRKLKGQQWIDWKNEQAITRTNRYL
ncbi:cupin-like domain-containing protein [Aureibaculum sp. 2210JD6-5]|uniref:cupin-like domain-containing protein n=1 Tax=Aureibaculum sp. 2210JD6-5 TaxID=3103957 RepID=UPI002AADB580|nr:cupin-like domain-containing protein [Aureibaculum sp. 2210JD6-5]MDY7394937.1 cupin-like domain-containing protein [Aureibaculum sp. 2210JD6-5]